MLEQEISRERPNKLRSRHGRSAENLSLVLCGVSAVLCILTAFNWPKIFTRYIYGMFGIYSFAIFFLAFFIGISVKLAKKYSVNKKYIFFSAVLLFSLFAGIHIVATSAQLKLMSFSDYLSHGFSSITPGGAIFAVPSFVIWTVFDGMIGSLISLGILVIVSGAFLTTFIVTKYGENKVIKKRNIPSIELDSVDENYASKEKELQEKVEAKYQELLEKQSRNKIDTLKSQLGLTAPPIRPITPAANYDAAVPLDKISPAAAVAASQPAPFVADEINQWSTDAANKFIQGLQPQPQQSYGNQFQTPQHFVQPHQFVSPVQPAAMQNFVPPTNSAVFNTPPPYAPIYQPNMTNYAQEQQDNIEFKPTSRARNSKSFLPAASGQMEFDVAAKPIKTYKPRRYVKPAIDLIRTESTDLSEFHIDAAHKQSLLDAKLKEFDINARVTSFTVAPAITRFEIQLGMGTRANDVYRLDPDFQYVLGTTDIRMENVPGKNAIGIEVPNKTVGVVSVKDILVSREWTLNKSPLAVAVGKNLSDEIIVGDIGQMPHLLIAGSTGSGKSVCINTLLTSLIYRAHPDDVKLLLVDMKLVELNMYNEIPHMLIPRSIGEIQQAINALKWMQGEMLRRYKILESNRFNHISQYHSLSAYQNGQLERMPYIIMVIDEAADLIHNGKKDVEDAIKRLSSLARACGIHIILATQRPSVDVITAVIKTNFPVRIAFKVNSQGDSRTIINEVGGEKLVGRGDMLFSKEGKIQRVQGAYIEVEEARRVMNFIRENNQCDFDSELEDLILNGPPQNNTFGGLSDANAARGQDEMFVPILRWLVRDENLQKTASIAGIQRQFSLGFTRAGRIMDQLTAAGFVTPGNGAKVREVLISHEEVDSRYGIE